MSGRIYKHICKECETNYYIEDLKLVAVARCPKCNGKGLYISEHEIKTEKCDDAFDSLMYSLPDWIPPFIKKPDAEELKGVKDIPYGDLNNLKPEPIKPLLVIELQDETSVPKVFYEGEEIKYKQNVSFDWETDTDIPGGLSYAIEYAEVGKGYPVSNRIERKVKGYGTY